MADQGKVLASSIADIPHLVAFEELMRQRLSALEIDALLIYIIDTVNESALPFLAYQFDVLGYKGYKLAATAEEKRRIIKQAIELKRYMGTVWAIREAMRSVGYGDAELEEGVDEGTPDVDWAKFRITVDLGGDKGIDGTTATELTRLINEYKNARSHLLDISYRSTLSDTLTQLFDTLYMDFHQPPIVEDLHWIARFADGTYFADGSINANEGNDYLYITIQ